MHARDTLPYAFVALFMGLAWFAWRSTGEQERDPALTPELLPAYSRIDEPAVLDGLVEPAAAREVAVLIAPEIEPRFDLSGVVRVVGRSPAEPLRGSISVATRGGGPGPQAGPSIPFSKVALSPQGEFEFRDVPRGVLFLRTSIEGAYDGLWIEALDPDEEKTRIELLARPMRPVSITVLQEDGSPLLAATEGPVLRRDLRLEWSRTRQKTAHRFDTSQKAELPLKSRSPRPQEPQRPVVAAMSGAAPDPIPARAYHFADEDLFACLVLGDRIVDCERVTPADGSVVLRLETDALRACTGRVSVVVVELGTLRPIPGAAVVVRSEDRNWTMERETDIEGRVELAHVPTGAHELVARRCAECRARTTTVFVLTGTSVASERFALDGLSSLAGRVEAGRHGLQGARVECLAVPSRRFPSPEEPNFVGARSADVTSDGSFEFQEVTPGTYQLRVVVGEHTSTRRVLDVDPEEDRTVRLLGP